MTERDPAERAEPVPPDVSATDAAGHTARLRGAALGWLPASPAVVALAGAVLPWFAPIGRRRNSSLAIPSAFSWQAGRIGYFAPLLLIIAAAAILGGRHGWFGQNAPRRTYTRDGWYLIAVGLAAGAVLALTWLLLPKSYTFTAGLSWNDLASLGYRLRRNPQPGYFLAIAAAADAVACGVVYLTVARRESRDEQADEAGKINEHDGKDPGR